MKDAAKPTQHDSRLDSMLTTSQIIKRLDAPKKPVTSLVLRARELDTFAALARL